MSTQEDVVIFLENLKTYLYGDLALFEKLCNEAEIAECSQKDSQSKVRSNEISIGDILCHESNSSTPITSSMGVTTTTTTTQTTQASGSEFSLKSNPIVFRSTIPHILSIFSTIDLVGFLLSKLKVKPAQTLKRVKEFFKNNSSISENDIELLILYYRHGMSHTYFPKKQLGIKAHSTNPKDELFFLEKDMIVLNANYLIELTRTKLESVLNDSSLTANMRMQFQKLIEHDNSNIAGLNIDSFKLSLRKV